jgi:hypothetical protein
VSIGARVCLPSTKLGFTVAHFVCWIATTRSWAISWFLEDFRNLLFMEFHWNTLVKFVWRNLIRKVYFASCATQSSTGQLSGSIFGVLFFRIIVGPLTHAYLREALLASTDLKLWLRSSIYGTSSTWFP